MAVQFGPENCVISLGDMSWMMVSTVLVLGMVPALGLFEAGLLRRKNTISILTQCLVGLVCLASLWFVIGYSVTLSGDVGGVIGDVRRALFFGMDYTSCFHQNGEVMEIPEPAYAIFQMMFACVTPLLITGTVAERMRWQPFLVFVVVWEIIVYYPLAHWIWGGGWLGQLGVEDFAGGIVIHTSSGAAALVVAWFLGPRHDYAKYHGSGVPHSDMRFATIGAALLWVGWFGFNGGSAFAASPVALHAVINTQLGAAFCGVLWLGLGWWSDGKPSVFHVLNGAIAGMAGITPASGFIDAPCAAFTCILLALGSFYGCKLLHRLHIDDALEVSCIHGVTGLLGSLAMGFCGCTDVNPKSLNGILYGGGPKLLGLQALGVTIALVYSVFCTTVIVFIISKVTRLRARLEHEEGGLDFWHHRLDAIHTDEREHRQYIKRGGAGGSFVEGSFADDLLSDRESIGGLN